MKPAKTLNAQIAQMEKAARCSENAGLFWKQIALVLQVWQSTKQGFMPTVQFDPRYQGGLRDLAAAYNRFKSALVDAVNVIAFENQAKP